MPAIGTHCILELYDCPPALLDDVAFVEAAVREASAAGKLTLLREVSHRFTPQGVTGLALLAESHLSVHTWPEAGYVAADVFTCGESGDPERACAFLVERFRAGRHTLKVVARGEGVDTAQLSAPPESGAENATQGPA